MDVHRNQQQKLLLLSRFEERRLSFFPMKELPRNQNFTTFFGYFMHFCSDGYENPQKGKTEELG